MVLFFDYCDAGWIGIELERRGLFTFRMPLILNKNNPTPNVRKTGFRSCYEMGIWLINDTGKSCKSKTFNFLNQAKMKNVLTYNIGRDGNKQTAHPTEKPETIIGRMISIFTNEGDVVLDNFAGSGTTGVAAYKLGRNCISIERDHGFIKMIEKRQKKAENRVISKGEK